MRKVLHISSSSYWDVVTTILLSAGLKYAPTQMQNSEAYMTDTLTFNSKYLWVVNKDLYPDAYVITQADIDVLNLLSSNPKAALEWLLNK